MTENPAQEPGEQNAQPPLENGTPDAAQNGVQGGAAQGAPQNPAGNGAPQGETIGATGDAQDPLWRRTPPSGSAATSP